MEYTKILNSGLKVNAETHCKLLEWKDQNQLKFGTFILTNDLISYSISDMNSETYIKLIKYAEL